MASDIFTKRAISRDVRDERGYRRYAAGDAAADVLRQVDDRLVMPEHAAWLASVTAVPGWAMPRHAVPGETTPYTQLRPDRPVKARPKTHRHNGLKHRKGKCWCGEEHKSPPVKRSRPNPQAWKPGQPAWITWWDWWQPPLPRKERREHEARLCEWVAPDDLPSWVRALDERKNEDGETEVLVPTGHLDPETGQEVLPWKKGGKERIHHHLEWAKYVYVNGEGKAAGIGTHPRVRKDLERGIVAPEGLFVFVIEGTLKLDSVISAGWPGIESGSVTLWNAEEEDYYGEMEEGDFGEPYFYGGTTVVNELEEFARRFLQGVPTVIVCDSDADVNRRVRKQVREAVLLLERCGVPAVGGAPPPGRYLDWENPATGQPMFKKQGVDDWLAKMDDPGQRHDGFLDLHVWDGEPPGLEAAVRAATKNPRGEEIHRGFLTELARDALPGGYVEYRPQVLKRRLDRNEKNIDLARAKHEKLGHLTTVIEAERVVNAWDDVKMLPPLLRLRDDLQMGPARRLRDWLTDVS